MFLNAVILVLQEILEAVMLISVMLVLTNQLRRYWPDTFQVRTKWVVYAVLSGTVGACFYAWIMPTVSAWFDYSGLEIIDAVMQFGIIGSLLGFCYALNPAVFQANAPTRSLIASIFLIAAVALGIVREGSEIILYGAGIIGQPENFTPVVLGGLMAAGIGISSGWFLFYGLVSLKPRHAFRAALVLLALFAGNMAAQGVLLLTQADWLPYTAELWDSSNLLAEYSVPGQLLYALIGYEANPSLLQAGAYIVTALLVLSSPLLVLARAQAQATSS
ncbi:MAG: FTR1 family protein [Pseudomonadota bacterium]